MGKGSVRLVKAGELGEGGVFEGVGLKGIGLPTLAVFLDLKYNRVKPYLVNRPWPKRQFTPKNYRGRTPVREKTCTTPYFAVAPPGLRETPGLSFAKQKGHPLMHMQEDKFSSQPPALREAPRSSL